MPDYSKLTVVKLKEELTRRGLPKTGLKPVLVNRLIENDDEQTQIDVVINAKEAEPPAARIEESSQSPIPLHDPGGAGEESNGVDNEEPLRLEPRLESNTDAVLKDEESSPDVEPAPEIQEKDPVPVAPEETIQEENSTRVEDAEPQPHVLVIDPAAEEPEAPSSNSGVNEGRPEQESTDQSTVEQSAPNDNPSTESTQALATENELLEDSRKRKRRSQSLPPSDVENLQKRAKMDDSRPHVDLPEDKEVKVAQDEKAKQSEDTNMADIAGVQPSNDNLTTTTDAVMDEGNQSTAPDTSSGQANVPEPALPDDDISKGLEKLQPDTDSPLIQHADEVSSVKHSPTDTRFKNLFTGPPKRETTPVWQAPYSDQEDRAVSPALHPATSALYIRDCMRPLHPGNLKAHLIALATPSDSTPDAQVITEFFLDPIRTHCLVGFVNTSAASRVRSSLHNRVWPEERTRRPLWVDFVPDEKIKKWIEVELGASSSRGEAAKRWEVVYEDEEDGIKAYLQEAGSNPAAPRPIQRNPFPAEVGQGVQGAPSGPRTREAAPRPSRPGAPPIPDHGKGFQALDDLFKFTAAKPKLYYLPVDKYTADKRLDKLDAGRGGGRGDEMRRYTFEDSNIVDRGPEFGSRGGRGGGGGYGARGGGYGGGYQGRGGGYRGETWRENWRENWRDRR